MVKSYYQLAQENIEKSSKAIKLYDILKKKVKFDGLYCMTTKCPLSRYFDGYFCLMFDGVDKDTGKRCQKCIDIFGK
ncbi:MAG: hypothetical protein ACFFG0_02690 [Candidatus Thorarchaeota archaeon]